jgi:hypothetical protein
MMAMNDATRRQLFQLLERDTSPETAALLMDNLPPQGWDAVATKLDLEQLEGRFADRFTGLDDRFKGLEDRFKGLEDRFEGLGYRMQGLSDRVDALSDRIDSNTDRVMNLVGAELRNQSRNYVFGSIGVILATAGVVLAAVSVG